LPGGGAADRLLHMHEALSALLDTGLRIAEAVHNHGMIPVPVTGDETEPEAGPFVLRAFTDNFVVHGAAGIGHVVYGYQRPNGDGVIDPNAQFHLQQVIGELLTFNLYCQRAEMEGALGVALQAPGVAERVDGILIKLAFFAAFFENMAASSGEGVLSDAAIERQRGTIERQLLVAQDKMSNGDRLEGHIPPVEWPFVGVELAFEPHDGDYFINCVYFPAQHAQVLLAAQQRANERGARIPEAMA
jgi:hypothetical protein